MSLTEGYLVNTPFGAGRIARAMSGGYLVTLDAGGIQLFVPAGRVTTLSSNTTQPSETVAAQETAIPRLGNSAVTNVVETPPRSIGDDETETGAPAHVGQTTSLVRSRSAQASVDSLRFGLVPTHEIRRLTARYETIADFISSQLPRVQDAAPCVAAVYGAYGAGKSHTMALARNIAMERGFLTAKVEVDGKEVTLAEPEGLLGRALPTLRGRNLEPTMPMWSLYSGAAKRRWRPPRIAVQNGVDNLQHNFEMVTRARRSSGVDDYAREINSFLSCQRRFTVASLRRLLRASRADWAMRIEPKRVIAARVAERPTSFLEAIIGIAKLAEATDHAGLVLTVDEFEVETSATGRPERVQTLLELLESWCRGELDYPPAPIGLFFASTRTEGHRIDDDVVDGLVAAAGGQTLDLEPYDEEALLELADHVRQLYGEAYLLAPGSSRSDRDLYETAMAATGGEGAGRIRAYLKTLVALLDDRHGPPGLPESLE